MVRRLDGIGTWLLPVDLTSPEVLVVEGLLKSLLKVLRTFCCCLLLAPSLSLPRKLFNVSCWLEFVMLSVLMEWLLFIDWLNLLLRSMTGAGEMLSQLEDIMEAGDWLDFELIACAAADCNWLIQLL